MTAELFMRSSFSIIMDSSQTRYIKVLTEMAESRNFYKVTLLTTKLENLSTYLSKTSKLSLKYFKRAAENTYRCIESFKVTVISVYE